jgi:DNA-binding XRE family transcriptional regulator
MAIQNLTEFRWNKARNDAAILLAADEITDTAIAEKVGVTRQTLYNWREHPDFQARVQEHIAELEAVTLRYAIAKKRNRVAWLDRDLQRLERVQAARAEEHKDIPGGDTGLLVRQVKQIGAGRDVQVVEEYAVDVPLLKEKRETMKQAATELRQWTDQIATEHSGNVHVAHTYADILAAAEADDPGSAGDHRP